MVCCIYVNMKYIDLFYDSVLLLVGSMKNNLMERIVYNNRKVDAIKYKTTINMVNNRHTS